MTKTTEIEETTEPQAPTITKSSATKLDRKIQAAWGRSKIAMGDLIDGLREMDETRGYMTLGYRSLTEYVTANLMPHPYKLMAEDRRRLALAMRQMGLSLRTIGNQMSVSAATVKSDIEKAVDESDEDITLPDVEDRHGRKHDPVRTATLPQNLPMDELEALDIELGDVELTIGISRTRATVEDIDGTVFASKKSTSDIESWWQKHRYDFAEARVREGKSVPEWYREYVNHKVALIQAADAATAGQRGVRKP